MTRCAPAARCASSSARVRPREVASSTVSTPSSPQGGMAGWSFPVSSGIWRPRDVERPVPHGDFAPGTGPAACRTSGGRPRAPAPRVADRRRSARRSAVVEDAEEVPPDPAKAENSDARHGLFLPHQGRQTTAAYKGGIPRRCAPRDEVRRPLEQKPVIPSEAGHQRQTLSSRQRRAQPGVYRGIPDSTRDDAASTTAPARTSFLACRAGRRPAACSSAPAPRAAARLRGAAYRRPPRVAG